MTVRPFDWRDLPALLRNRRKSVFLDSALLLTRGPMLVPGALFSSLAPSMGVLTSVSNSSEKDDPPVIGQVMHLAGSQFAHLTFLTPEEAAHCSAVQELLDYLAGQVGERGAFRLLADVDEGSLAYEALRQASYAIYTRQRIWRITGEVEKSGSENYWRTARDQDLMAIRSLYHNLVPGLVQQSEPFVGQQPRGLVCCSGDELLGYVELKYGHRGIWAQPFVHPDAEDLIEHFVDFLQSLPSRRSRPVYLCVRSYQSWLEPSLEMLGVEPGPRQAVMVKHLAVQQKAVRAFNLPALEGGQPEVTAPIIRSESK